jgi:hypothetical protein
MSGAADTLWQCQSENCGALVRAADLRHIATPGATFEVCPHCGGAVATTEPPTVSADAEARERVPSFSSALVYPFHGWGLVALGVGTFLVGLLEFGLVFLISYVAVMLVYGYACNYLFDVVLTTANGEDAPPGFPDFTHWWEDILRPILLVVSTTLLCFVPSFLYFVWYLWHCWYEGWVPDPSEPTCAVGVLGLALLSSLYYPMALLAVVMHDARRAADPRLVIPAIARVLRPYLTVCGFMVLTGLVRVGFRAVFTGDSLLAHFTAVLLSLWGAMASMRLLGLLYRAHQEKLGWF